MTVFPAVRISFIPVIRAESAIINTFIGRFNMKIMIEIGEIAVMPSSYNSGKQTKQRRDRLF